MPIAGAALAVVVALFLPAGASAGTLDQEQTLGPQTLNLINSTASHAQVVTAGRTGLLDQVDLVLSRVNAPTTPLTVEIRPVSDSCPTAEVVASTDVPAGDISTIATYIPISFTNPVSVVANARFAIVTHAATPLATGSYAWGSVFSMPAPNPYPNGAACGSTTTPPDPLFPEFADTDYMFKTYVQEPGSSAPPPTGAPPVTGERDAALKKCKKKHSNKKRKKCRKRARQLPV
jgi:hypothetical protein